MDREVLAAELKTIIADYLENKNIDLVDFICRYEGKNLFLKILADKPEGGITLGECSYINQDIGKILDEKDILQEKYILEVSSPGIDRPLESKNDFSRCILKPVAIFLTESINGKTELRGTITGVEDNLVRIDIDGQAHQIPFNKIRQAKQIIR
jgi:ribosome maturation factor RimP